MRFSVLLLSPLFVACQNAGDTKVNASPSAVITSHEDGDSVREFEPTLLVGQVSDSNDAIGDLTVTWMVGDTEVCTEGETEADGAVSCRHTFAEGDGEVRLSVRDPLNAEGSTSISLVVEPADAPVVALSSPTAEGKYYADQTITFAGTVSDAEDPTDDLTITIETDDLGDLGMDIDVTSEGVVEAFGLLDEGEHAVRLRAVDTHDKEGSDSVVITVGPPNSAPTCAITEPVDGTAGAFGEEVQLAGTVDDADEVASALSVVWESDKDGSLGETTADSDGSVGLVLSDLSTNTHRITLTVTDELGESCTTSVYYTVGMPPTLAITAPVDDDILSASEAITFTAEVSDREDASTDISLEWTIDGELFSDEGADSAGVASFPWDASTWAIGEHTVEVTATDTDGLYVNDAVTFTINAPPTAPTVVINPDPATTTDNLFAVATDSVDPDESGSVTYRYVWFADGIEVPEVSGPEYPADQTAKDHTYRVEVYPSDGLHEGASTAAERTVINTAPTITEVSVTPDAAPVGTVLTCSAVGADDDEDVVGMTYQWTDGTVGDTFTIPEAAELGDIITCTATADDGDEGIVSATADALVTNTPPVMTDTSVAPLTARVGDTLTCSATATDIDEDAITYTYEWTDGSTEATYTLTEADDPDDIITCTATATDETGAYVIDTAEATVLNTDPVIAATMTPESAAVGDTLTCSATATDTDGGDPVITFAWSTGSVGPTYEVSPTDNPATSITCTATATDEDGGTDTDAVSALVDNTDPVFVSISVTPPVASVGDTLVCDASATDADGGAPAITYAWSDGAIGPSRLVSSLADPGTTLTCTATADDGDGGVVTVSADATISNTPPVVDSVSITPDIGKVGDTLTCAATASDADADAPTITYAWSTGETGSSYTLTVSDDPGETITCTATATDPDGGSSSDTATAIVENTPPTLVDISLTPDAARVGDTLTCAATATDADGDDPRIDYAWSTGATGTTYTLEASDDPGTTISCTATTTDDQGASDAQTANATVLNTDPVFAGIAVSPTTGAVGDTLTCSATATDADGGEPSITYAWSDGESGASRSITAAADPGTTLTCTATADDGDGGVVTTSADATVTNSLPTVDSVAVSAATVVVGDTLTCTATASDVDGDSPSIAYAWSDGSTGSSYEVRNTDDPGDTITCTATATDPDGGSASDSASATVENTNPVVTAVSVIPDAAKVGTLLVCSASATDVDGGEPSLSYAWSNGSTGANLVISDDDSPGTTLTCTATATDEDGGTASDTADALVENTNPEILSVGVSPSSAKVGESLTCTATATDADGDEPALSYTWSDGALGSSRVVSTVTNPGETITCTVTATDEDGGADTATATATVDNTAPSLSTVSVAPSTAQVGDTVTCSTSATDVDGGTPTIAYSWSTGTSGDTYTLVEGDDPGDTLTCTATATDTDGGSTSDTGSATVANTNPVLAAVTVSPSSAKVGETLTCATTATDADGGTPTIAYAWQDGSSGDSYTLTAGDDPGDTITCTATATDTDGGSDSDTDSATVENTVPVIDAITVSESTVQVGDTLTCSASASDADGGSPTITYAWSTGATGATYTVAASDDPGDTLTCTATAEDADGGSTSDTASATVQNTDPVIASIDVSPSTGQVSDTLVCSATASDADGEAPTIAYTWSTGDSGATYTITSSDDPGDTLTCTATATDTDGGSDTGTASATVENTAPVVSIVSILPATVYNDDTLSCSASASDADGGTPSVTYEWSGGATGATIALTSIIAAPGDVMTCTATATDAEGESDSATDSVTIANRAPSIGSVSIAPAAPTTGDTLTCAASGVSDPDDEGTTTTYAWTIDGVSVSTAAVLSTSIVSGESIACVVTVTDASGESTQASQSVTVQNTPPEVVSVSLSPGALYTNDTVVANATSTDADGDVVTLEYAFAVNGVTVQSGSSSTLDGASYFDKDDEVSVTVTPDDGTETGTSGSASVTVLNSTPTAPTVSIAKVDVDFAADFNGGTPIVAPTMDIGETGDRTFMAWVKPELGSEMKIFGLGGDPNMVLKSNPAGHLVVQCSGGTQGVADVLTTNQWTHVAITWSDNTMRMYADGERILERTMACPIEDNAMFVGAALSAAPFPWSGAIDEVKVWAAQLSDSEVADELDNGLARSSDARAYYALDEGTGTDVSDLSGNDKNAAHAQATWTAGHGNDDSVVCEWGSDYCLVCSIDEAATDEDGDTISYTFDWDVDGDEFTDTETTTYDGDTVTSDELDYDEAWTCEVTPDDGESAGTQGSATYLTEICDADADGYLSADCGGADCDDTDPSSTNIDSDADCDGTVTEDDCDDTDSSSTVVAEDADCDGVVVADDCDDTDSSLTSVTEDADCDGTATADDCDDTDSSSTVVAEDADCDEVVAADDCDDDDATIGELCWSQVEVGFVHTCGLTSLGDIECWGADNFGSTIPPVGTFDVVSAAYYGGCAIDSSGSIECWGRDDFGETSPPSGSFEFVTSGDRHSCALTASDSIECWGNNWLGKSDPPSGAFQDINLGYGHSCGVRASGVVECWGRNDDGEASPPTGTFTSVSAGFYHTCGVTTSGTVECWGGDEHGETSPPTGTFSTVSAGYKVSCGVTTTGTVECWGKNDKGQADPPSGTFSSVSVLYQHACGLTTSGDIECWGSDTLGQSSPPSL